jgi:mRNA interferase MazF
VASWASWTPGRGDLVSIAAAFHERPGEGRPGEGRPEGCPGRRPALVLTPAAYSAKTGRALVCAIVDQVNGYPFEVELPVGLGRGVILCDQIWSLEWRAWGVRLVGRVPDEVVVAVRQRIVPLVA